MFIKLNVPPVVKQMFAASGPLIVTLGSGMTVGFSAVLLPQLKDDHSAIRIDSSQESWIASMAALPMAAGSVLGGISMDKMGRKTTNLLICVPFVIGWAAVSLAKSLPAVFVGRLLTGLCTGMMGPPSAVYIAEVTEPQYRGAALAMISFSISAGILAVHTMGTFLDWRLVSALCSLVPFAGYLIIWFTPESPIWLREKGLVESAERAHSRLSGKPITSVDCYKKTSPTVTAEQKPNFWKCIGRTSFLEPLVVLVTFFFVQQFSGVNAVAFYSVTLLRRISPELNEYYSTIALDVIRLAVSILACCLTRKFGRRPLAVISAAGTSISLLCLAVSVQNNAPSIIKAATASPITSPNFNIIPLLSIVAYMLFVNIGLVPLPWIMAGEMFPSYCRELGSGLSTSFGFIMFYLVIQFSPLMLANIGTSMTFTIFGAVAGTGAIFLYLCLPETKNKTINDVS
ncbi:facilitated trehalose transporter Tret1-like [Daktulosphaira vitifoliae]|uniref:facilitated trehalose transporter Tret1-like n=1 Tax=Daktulosphaira vitifoliae TaxID=58002 RepID=UPI0021AADEEA|nr:facilitated trehalose transporter Tret1-like [Daktulosphaira vitifoliae]